MCWVEHARPQAPQLLGSLVKWISHPSSCLLLLQSAKGKAQVPLQVPLPQVGTGTLFGEQTRPQPPQLLGSEVTLVSQPSVRLLPLQSRNPAAHTPDSHEPFAQALAMWLAEHAAPQAPQLSRSAMLVSQPSVRLLALQSLNPVAQTPDSHEPFAHAAAM
jgi:hypothetical protein